MPKKETSQIRQGRNVVLKSFALLFLFTYSVVLISEEKTTTKEI
jgi:hypothetical protein